LITSIRESTQTHFPTAGIRTHTTTFNRNWSPQLPLPIYFFYDEPKNVIFYPSKREEEPWRFAM